MEWYNVYMQEKMYDKFISQYGNSLEEVERLLNGDNFEDFCLACNYLNKFYNADALQDKSRLIKIANDKVRDRIGSTISELYDYIVTASKQTLWRGDELYKLFSYDIPPYYVMQCIKSTLYIANECMTNKVNTVQDCIRIAEYAYNPPYWRIYHEDFRLDNSVNNKIRKKECIAWHKIAEYLFNGDITSAVAFLECVRKE